VKSWSSLHLPSPSLSSPERLGAYQLAVYLKTLAPKPTYTPDVKSDFKQASAPGADVYLRIGPATTPARPGAAPVLR
jgi:hypothetical protein